MGHSRRRITIIATLLIAPVLIVPIINWKVNQKNRRDDELFAIYDQDSRTYESDFNGDGTPGRIDFRNAGSATSSFVVVDGGRELLTLPYDHTDGTLRTHLALTRIGNKSRLVVYDGTTNPATRSAFVWNGEKMVQSPPSTLESEILTAMAAHDDTGGWGRRVFFDLTKSAAVAAYYFLVVLAVLFFIVFRKSQRNPKRIAADS